MHFQTPFRELSMYAFLLRFFASAVALGIFLPPAWAGMPPSPFAIRVDQLLTYRIEALSFFLALTFLLAGVVKLIWNTLRIDFPKMPRLTYWRAMGAVFLWGLIVAVVLSMITGARELMTPGAWERAGGTYRLTQPGSPAENLLIARRKNLERLKEALWSYARAHDGRFPDNDFTREVPEDVWTVPSVTQPRYIYIPRRGITASPGVTLAYEPDVFDDDRLALLTNGEVITLKRGDIYRLYYPPTTAPADGGGR